MTPTPVAIHVLDKHDLRWEQRWQVIDRATEIARDNCRDRVTAGDVRSRARGNGVTQHMHMIAETATTPVGIPCPDLSNEDYHADTGAFSASALEDFRDSRRLFEARYITKTLPPKAATPAMELGTCVHLRILEPERYFATLAEPFPEEAPDGKKWLSARDRTMNAGGRKKKRSGPANSR